MKTQVSALESWFDANPERPRLIGSRCRSCRSYFFPKESFACRNPSCGAAELEDVPLTGDPRRVDVRLARWWGDVDPT